MTEEETKNARWQGAQETKVEGLTIRVGRLEKIIAASVLALAGLYLRSIGVLP
jgi:hypothetical protein